jgi:putative FmdB family regulatory protein
MPIYEFQCAECNSPFEELVRSAEAVNAVVCPKCGSGEVRKKVSMFASRISGGSTTSFSSAASDCAPGGT